MGKRRSSSKKRSRRQLEQTRSEHGAVVSEGGENGANRHHPSSKKRSRGNDDDNEQACDQVGGETLRKELGLTVTVDGDSTDSTLPIPSPFPSAVMKNGDGPLQQTWSYMEKKKNKKRHRRGSETTRRWTPTPIQLQSWPILLSQEQHHNRVIGIAPTGSGKTLAYGLPMISHAHQQGQKSKNRSDKCVKPIVYGLVLVPTRELATQVAREISMVCKAFEKTVAAAKNRSNKIRVVPIYGGVQREEQVAALTGTTSANHEKEKNDDVNARNSLLIVVGTPGRMLDLLKEEERCSDDEDDEDTSVPSRATTKSCTATTAIASHFANVGFVVLDEADRMAINSDIAGQVDAILAIIMRGRSKNEKDSVTTCLYSATYPEHVADKWKEWVGAPRVCIRVDTITLGGETKIVPCNDGSDKVTSCVNVVNENAVVACEQYNHHPDARTKKHVDEKATPVAKQNQQQRGPLDLAKIPAHVTQTLHVCAGHKKPRKLIGTLNKIRKDEEKDGRARRRRGLCIVFFARIKTLQYICKFLIQEGFQCAEIHSQLNQCMRERALANFRAGKVTILLATDIAARGIHVNNIQYVINYDFPVTLEQYVHRCGRAGRNRASSDASMAATAHSFFTRDLAPMAKDIVSLLRSSNAWIDPNLVALVSDDTGDDGRETPKRKRRRGGKGKTDETLRKEGVEKMEAREHLPDHADDMDWDDGQFAHLSANRIVLKKASHVSDASDTDEDNE